MQNFISGLFRFVIKAVLTVFGLLFAFILILLALTVVVLSLLKAVITGKKPTPRAVFGSFTKFAPGAMWRGRSGAKPASDVVDVEMREVKDPLDDKKRPLDLT